MPGDGERWTGGWGLRGGTGVHSERKKCVVAD